MTKTFEIVYRDPAELIPYEMNAKMVSAADDMLKFVSQSM